MSARRLLALASLGALLGLPQPVAAGPSSRPRGERAPKLEDFWRPSAAARRDSRRLAEALRQLQGALNPLSPRTVSQHPARFRQAVATLRLLALTHPKEPRYWYWYGHAAHLARDDATTRRAWLHVWKLDPDHWSGPDTAFTLGVLLAKIGRYRESVRIYSLGMPRAARLSTRSIMASNCAESAMALGQLRTAERLYRESLILRPRGNSAAWWGLMVALDRQGHTFAAEQAAREALLVDPTLAGLIGPDVFFVPAGDVHYYLALAYQVGGQPKRALAEWRRFLRRRPQSPYVTRAREHLRVLDAQVARFRPRAWLARVVPAEAQPRARTLLPLVQRCYAARSKLPGLPEGPLPLMLRVQHRRIQRVEPGWAPFMIRDGPLQRCVSRSLRGRPFDQPGHDRVFVTFRLERAP